MKKLLFLLGLFTLTACSSTTSQSTLDNKGNSYSTYSLKSATNIPDGHLKNAFENALHKELLRYGYSVGKDVNLTYNIKKYDEGLRFGRWWWGPLTQVINPELAAKSTIEVKVTTVKGKSLGTVNTHSELYAGFFGGDALNSVENAAEDIAKEIHQSGILKSNK
ncbi:hypothetical protein A1D22_07300 [Pasteurellaceae bacterium LFhippo2]|nr:hypothetical protein [Pasteurellaceae bacterium LFhippo2]